MDIQVSEPLRREGIARELVNRIQNIRKSNGFDITDKISIRLSRSEETDAAVEEYKSYILNQVLGVDLQLSDTLGDDAIELDFDNLKLRTIIVKI